MKNVKKRELFDFPPEVKEEVFKRDDYRCVICGLGTNDGVEITVDHLVPKDKGGLNTVENGQTLCTPHNLLKKNYSQTEIGKRFFRMLYETATRSNDQKLIKFCKKIFALYDKYGFDQHINNPA